MGLFVNALLFWGAGHAPNLDYFSQRGYCLIVPALWTHLPSKAGIYLGNHGICCPFPTPSDISVQLTVGDSDSWQTQNVPFQPWFESLLLKTSECITHFSKLHPNSSLRYCLHINKTLFLPSLLLQCCSGFFAHTKLKIKIT